MLTFLTFFTILVIFDYFGFRRIRKNNPNKVIKQNDEIESAIVNIFSSIAIMLVAIFIPLFGPIALLLLARRFNPKVRKVAIFFGILGVIIALGATGKVIIGLIGNR